MAIRLSRGTDLSGSTLRPAVEVSPARVTRPESCGAGGAGCRPDEAGRLSHVLAFVRDAPAGRWLRHPDRAEAVGALRRQHDHDVHPRPESGCARRTEP